METAQIILLISPAELENIILSALQKHDERTKTEKFVSVNQAAKLAHVAHATVKKAIAAGKLQTNGTGKISESDLQNFLKTY